MLHLSPHTSFLRGITHVLDVTASVWGLVPERLHGWGWGGVGVWARVAAIGSPMPERFGASGSGSEREFAVAP
jgi:hypothetical protein